MMKWNGLAAFACVGLAIGVASDANAYCVATAYAEQFSYDFPSTRIPVHLATTGHSSIEHTGLSSEDATRIVIEAIARHNETVVAPKLYFAGSLEQDFALLHTSHPYEHWPKGIVINSFDCGLLVNDDTVANGHLCKADETSLHACAKPYLNVDGEVVGIATLLPSECEHAIGQPVWSMSKMPYDMVAVLMHEIGHVLGLRHPNDSADTCVEGGDVPGNDPEGNVGVMSTPQSGMLASTRHWRRDDLDGFDRLYRDYAPIYETAIWADEGFPDYPALDTAQRITGARVRRTSSLSADPLGDQLIVSVDQDQRIVAATLNPESEIIEDYAVVDPGPLGRTWGSPESAIGTVAGASRAMIAWTAGESSITTFMHARWAIRDLGNQGQSADWEFSDGFGLRTPRLGLGFDPSSGNFLVSTLSAKGYPEISVVDFDGQLLAERLLVEPIVTLELGNVVCDSDPSACSLLFSSSDLSGPSLGRIDFGLSDSGDSLSKVQVEVFGGQDVYGRVTLAADEPDAFRGVAGWRRYMLSVAPMGPPEPQPVPSFPLRDWPLGLGAYAQPGQNHHRLTMPIAIECGNGMIESGEQCDDGNFADDDGCDSTCAIELLGPSDDDDQEEDNDDLGESETGETGGGYGALDGEDCECGVNRRFDASALALGILALCGVALRRRCRRQPRLPRYP